MSMRVLVVDDERDDAVSLMLLLSDEGYAVKGVSNGDDMWSSLTTFRPDAILLDIGLPGGDGYELAWQLRARLRERCPPLIAVTGRSRDADRIRAELAGFRHYLCKPYDPLALIGLLNSVNAGRPLDQAPAR